MNKRGFDCALSRATSRSFFRRFSASQLPYLIFSSILPRLLALYFFFFILYPIRSRTTYIPFAYISLTSLSSTPLHHEIQLRFIPPKLIFILLDSLACPKMNITIYCMLHACCTHAASLPPELSIKLQSSVFICIEIQCLPLISCGEVCADRIMNHHAGQIGRPGITI